MADHPRLWTVDDFFELPGREKIELWDGRPVGPKAMERRLGPFRRTMAELRLLQHLGGYVAARDLGLFGPGFGFVGATDRALHPPDLAFIRHDRLPAAVEWDGLSPVVPDLAIEIVSPVDHPEQVAEDIDDYLAGGVPLLWVFDPWRRTVDVRAPDRPTHVLGEGDDLDGCAVLPGFRVPGAELFR